LLGTLRAPCQRRLDRGGESVSARSDFGCDLIEVKLHSFGVAGRQHEGGAGISLRWCSPRSSRPILAADASPELLNDIQVSSSGLGVLVVNPDA
jgi:hypothetical protein